MSSPINSSSWYIARILVNIPCLIWCRFWWAGQSCEWLTQHLCYVDMVMHLKFLQGLWPKPVHHSFTSSCASFCRGSRRVIFQGKNKKELKYSGLPRLARPPGLGLAWILQNRKRRPWILLNSSLVNRWKKWNKNIRCLVCSLKSKRKCAYHSMVKENFNKSKETTPTNSAALRVAP